MAYNTLPLNRNHINWKRTTADVLALVGTIALCCKGPDMELWLNNVLYPTPATVSAPGASQAELLAVADQLRTALQGGGQETFASEAVQCTYGNQVVTIENPIVMVLDNGKVILAAVVPSPNNGPYDVMLIDPRHPGAPIVTGNPACAYMPDPSQPKLQFETMYDFYFQGGDPLRPISATDGRPLQNTAGDPLGIGRVTTP